MLRTVCRSVVAALVLACLLTPLRAQEPRVSPGLSQYLTLVQFSVASGRITCTSTHTGRSITSSTTGPGAHRSEQLRINATGGMPTVKYERNAPEFTLTVEFSGGQEVHVLRSPHAGASVAAVKFDQVPGQDLELIVQGKGPERHYAAKSFWHLLLTEQEVCREQLVPLLELVRPDWQLMASAKEIEAALVAWVSAHDGRDAASWRALVEQLGSDRFATRRRAERQLLLGGQRVAVMLEGLDLDELDAEQRFRARRLIDQFSSNQGDRPQRVAGRLAGDVDIWLSLLARGDLDRRQVAAEQLNRLLQRPIDFDPDASPAVRAAKLDALRHELASQQAD